MQEAWSNLSVFWKRFVVIFLLSISGASGGIGYMLQPSQILPATPIKSGGMGIIELEMGCEKYMEWGVLNKTLYDSIVVKVKVNCNSPTMRSI